MARSIAEIYNTINADKASMQELNAYVVVSGDPTTIQDNAIDLANDINSGSKVANWRLWIWIMAVASWVVETLFDYHTADIEARLAAERPHTLKWYAMESKKFQYGYAVSWIDDHYGYEVDDPASHVIKYCASREKGGYVVLKVKGDNNGVRIPLPAPVMDAFSQFWAKWRDAGVKLQFVSQAADQLKINITIVRDRLVLDSSNNLLRDSTINPINNAINAFGDSLEFDGIIRLSKLEDAIQAAEGVVDASLTAAWVKPSGGEWTSVNMYVESVSGDFELSYSTSNFTYIDSVNVEILS